MEGVGVRIGGKVCGCGDTTCVMPVASDSAADKVAAFHTLTRNHLQPGRWEGGGKGRGVGGIVVEEVGRSAVGMVLVV